jgi:formylglycine-generating enzyme required for sulfatase activity/energy-coupling factor transporter ATP-binding protein EcfA2
MPNAVTEPKREFDLFLSYNRLDQPSVEPLAEALRGRQLKVFKDDWYLSPGEHWPSALERRLAQCKAVAVLIGPHGMGPWQQREVYAAIDREVREHASGRSDFRVIPILLDEGGRTHAGLGFLSQNVWVEAWDPRAIDRIVGALDGKAPAELYDEVHPDPRTLICPYRGLGVFGEEDRAFYFGREADLKKLTAAVDQHPLVAIVGASGSGKSSLARAGLLPRLRRQTAGRVWQMVTVDHPGRHPFRALAQALLPLWEPKRVLEWSKNEAYQETKTLAESLAGDGVDRLHGVLREIFVEEPGTTDLLLLVDQWEELYTYRPERALPFIQMLLEAVRERGLQVVLTVRADYWGEVLSHHPPLAARLAGEATVHLPALLRDGLAAVIRKPAEQTRLAIEPALVEALLNDAEDQPGDLPLLEFALRQLWAAQTGSGKGITRQAYEAMGRLAGAIVHHAEAAYQRLTPEERDAVPGVFAALVQVGEARTDLRRRARLTELSEAGQAVARRLANERLLVTSRDWTSGDEWVEVAHEALLRHWPKLSEWIDRRRGSLLTVRQLQADTRTWLQKQKNASYQWSHERVREAVAALSQIGDEVVLSREEQAFLGPIEPQGMLAELESRETSHKRRLLIGERLGVLGDSRPGVGVDANATPQIDWRPVSGGEVTVSILSEPNDPYSEVADTRRKRVEAFHLGRFPVTVAQYRAFIGAKDGWRDPAWWEDDLYRDADGNTYEFGRFGNHPVVYVSWFDAVAFCRWLSRRLGFRVCLLDEWEWQQAATGGDEENHFPWGSDWDAKTEPWRANTFESRLGQPTAAGMYPQGASPTGALDMAGTVWEWCLNKFDTPEVARSGARDFDFRVLRGGSWGNHQDLARSAYRNGSQADDRSNNVGLRVVGSSPSSDTVL